MNLDNFGFPNPTITAGVGIGGEYETADTGSKPELEPEPGDLPMDTPSKYEQDITTIESSVDSAAKESPQQNHAYHLRILIEWDELSDKMAELHYKDIKNFWLCGRIENGKLLDMALERGAMTIIYDGI
jgi:hypothetical protein